MLINDRSGRFLHFYRRAFEIGGVRNISKSNGGCLCRQGQGSRNFKKDGKNDVTFNAKMKCLCSKYLNFDKLSSAFHKSSFIFRNLVKGVVLVSRGQRWGQKTLK